MGWGAHAFFGPLRAKSEFRNFFRDEVSQDLTSVRARKSKMSKMSRGSNTSMRALEKSKRSQRSNMSMRALEKVEKVSDACVLTGGLTLPTGRLKNLDFFWQSHFDLVSTLWSTLSRKVKKMSKKRWPQNAGPGWTWRGVAWQRLAECGTQWWNYTDMNTHSAGWECNSMSSDRKLQSNTGNTHCFECSTSTIVESNKSENSKKEQYLSAALPKAGCQLGFSPA